MSPARRHPGRGQRGSIMVIVMTILAALLAGGAIALYLQLSSTRAAGSIRESRSALYCAEAGLQAARPLIGANYAEWVNILDGDPDTDPSWYPVRGDLDGDGVNDYEVRIRDNDDEMPPLDNDPTRDNDLRVFIISRCTKYPDTPREVLELVRFEGGGNVYRNQSGQGSGNTGNAN
jgi:hypothetical protein